MSLLVFRVDTTSLPKKGLPSAPDQPRVIRLSAKLFDKARRELAALDTLLKPSGSSVSAAAARSRHGLSDRDLVLYGVRPAAALATFMDMVRAAGELSAFNLDFASFMIDVELDRLKASADDWKRSGLRRSCVMVNASQALRGGKAIAMAGVMEELGWTAITEGGGLPAVDQIAAVHWELDYRRRTL